jgi:hypothetical protein
MQQLCWNVQTWMQPAQSVVLVAALAEWRRLQHQSGGSIDLETES